MKSIAIIPARGGSKRIPRKNIKSFLGKPIIAYSIEAAVESGLFEEVMVSTDDEEISEVAKSYGACVPFLRSAHTSGDYATSSEVILEVLDTYKKKGIEFDTACCLYATAPFITSSRLVEAAKVLDSAEYDTVFPVVAFSYPIFRGLEISEKEMYMVWPEYRDSRSQDLKPIYHDAGQFYFFRVCSFYRTKTLWGCNPKGLILSELEVQDLDTETDWKLAEMKYQLRSR